MDYKKIVYFLIILLIIFTQIRHLDVNKSIILFIIIYLIVNVK